MTRARRLVAVGALTGVALIGYLVGEAILSGHQSTPPAAHPAPHRATSSTARVPRRSAVSRTAGSVEVTPGVLVARSERGAAAAAASYLQLLEPTAPSAGVVARLRALTVAPLTGEALHAQEVSGALARRLSLAGPAFVRGWQVGWRVDSYSTTSARVAVWTMGLVEAASEVLAPYWSTSVCTLAWSHGSWRVSEARTTPGPTPPPDGIDRAAVASFVRSATVFQAFSDAP